MQHQTRGRAAVVVGLLLGCGCGTVPASGLSRNLPADQLRLAVPPTTAPAIALSNLEGAIGALLAKTEPLAPARAAELVELLLTRGRFLGRIDDYERADAIAEEAVRRAPESPFAYLARAGTAATFHRFPAALRDLERAASLGAAQDRVASARAAILQATGRYREALELRRRLAAECPGIATLAGEASVLAEMGSWDAAERRFGDALESYSDVSPFPVAWLYFERGRMWMRAAQLPRAREMFAVARRVLPQYAAATGHLGEVEAALGYTERALPLLRAAADASDDPDPAGQLARVLLAAGQARDAALWRDRALIRFEDLLARHPEGFADHGAEFFLGAGADPARALTLARHNFETRHTPAACTLLARAARAAQAALPGCPLPPA